MNKNHYLPLLYLETVKRPGQKYLLTQIITDDVLILFLGISWLAPQPFFNSVSLLILTFSLFCIYEIGYWENDKLGEQFEEKPNLSESYHTNKNYINYSWQPWFYSLLLAFPALLLFDISQLSLEEIRKLSFSNFLFSSELLTNIFWWLGLLIGLRLIFLIYNRTNVQARVWIFPVLQSIKCLGFLLFTSTNLIGIILFIAQVLSRWLPYLIYRYGGDRKDFPKRMARVFIFSFLLISLVAHENSFTELLDYKFQLVTVILFILLRALPDFKKVFNAIKNG